MARLQHDLDPDHIDPILLQLPSPVHHVMTALNSKPLPLHSPRCTSSVTQSSTASPQHIDSSISPPSSATAQTPSTSHSGLLQTPPGCFEPPSMSKTHLFPCQNCDSIFSSRKDRRRHGDSIHRTGSRFRCRCGKFDPRKDNHDRHVRSCRISQNGLYKHRFCCRCGVETDPNEPLTHLSHVAGWDRDRNCT